GHLVECSTGRIVKKLHGLSFLCFLPDESMLAFEAEHEADVPALVLRDPRTGKAIRTFKDILPPPGRAYRVVPVLLSPDGRTLFAGSGFKGGFFLDLETQKTRPLDIPALFFDAPELTRIWCAFSPDGNTVVTATSEIAVWDVASGKKRHADKRVENRIGEW